MLLTNQILVSRFWFSGNCSSAVFALVLLPVQGDCYMLRAASVHTSGLRSRYWSNAASVSPSCSGYYHLTSVTSWTKRKALVSLVFSVVHELVSSMM